MDSKARIIDLPSRRAAKILSFLNSEALRRAVDRATKKAIQDYFCLEHLEMEDFITQMAGVVAESSAYLKATQHAGVILPFPPQGTTPGQSIREHDER